MKTRRKLWFKAKEYGWGWFPITWQGWVVTVGYTALFTLVLVAFFTWVGVAAADEATTQAIAFGILEFLAAIGLMTYILIRICTHWGEKPGWRWGRKKPQR